MVTVVYTQTVCQNVHHPVSSPLLCQNWQNDIPAYDSGEAIESQYDEQSDADKEEDIDRAVALPGKVLKLERKHGNLSYKEPWEEQHQSHNEYPTIRVGYDSIVRTYHESTPKERIGRCGQSYKRTGLTIINIKLG